MMQPLMRLMLLIEYQCVMSLGGVKDDCGFVALGDERFDKSFDIVGGDGAHCINGIGECVDAVEGDGRES